MEWLEHNWRFASLRDSPEFEAVLLALRRQRDQT
jgi:hypothetical protein